MKPNIISVVDDDRIQQYAMTKTIESTRRIKKVLVFSDGEEAYEHLSKNIALADELPDVIFLDLNMPYMDGWEFLDEFANLKPRLPKKIIIYVVSSSVSEMDMNRAKEISDVTDYIVKPITMGRFDAILSSIENL
ncbi:MAG: response regulator [Bacteroidetes bacterium]|nr:MAG: response regulator [Bacteroidota bacterium]